jgi:hypothetical protein
MLFCTKLTLTPQTKQGQGVSFLCVNLEVLKTTTNTNIYHPNMAHVFHLSYDNAQIDVQN